MWWQPPWVSLPQTQAALQCSPFTLFLNPTHTSSQVLAAYLVWLINKNRILWLFVVLVLPPYSLNLLTEMQVSCDGVIPEHSAQSFRHNIISLSDSTSTRSSRRKKPFRENYWFQRHLHFWQRSKAWFCRQVSFTWESGFPVSVQGKHCLHAGNEGLHEQQAVSCEMGHICHEAPVTKSCESLIFPHTDEKDPRKLSPCRWGNGTLRLFPQLPHGCYLNFILWQVWSRYLEVTLK